MFSLASAAFRKIRCFKDMKQPSMLVNLESGYVPGFVLVIMFQMARRYGRRIRSFSEALILFLIG